MPLTAHSTTIRTGLAARKTGACLAGGALELVALGLAATPAPLARASGVVSSVSGATELTSVQQGQG